MRSCAEVRDGRRLGEARLCERLRVEGAPVWRGRALRVLLVAGVMAATGTLARAQIPQGDTAVTLQLVAEGLAAPVSLTGAGDGSGRLFVVDQAGTIRVIEDGRLVEEPFLDLTDRIVELGEIFDERGLLGLAFHPDYATNGRFFVRYSAPRDGAPDEPCNDPGGFIVGCHTSILAEFAVSAADPIVADPASERILFAVDQPQFNHNAGDLHFGPDGFLYFSLGDGGGANDGLADDPPSHGPIGNGQSIETPLGALLRIDVDGAEPFAVPPDNPFVGGPGVDAIYAYGFRNPYRFSFDSATGELFLADVGQDLFEEIDVVELGGNYGWVIREGAHCFDPFDPTNPPAMCQSAGLIDPVAEYDHSDGLAVVGGFVARGGAQPELEGKYLFGDFSRDFGPTGRLFYLDADGDRSQIFELQLGGGNAPLGLFVKGFGRDDAGEIYLLASADLPPSGTSGVVLRIAVARPFIRGDANSDGAVDIADAVASLDHLFGGGASLCRDAADANDDGRLDLADPIYGLGFLLGGGGPPPPPPFPNCGQDPTPDAGAPADLGCESPAAICL